MITIRQTGYECEREMRLFSRLFFLDSEDVTIDNQFVFENGRVHSDTSVHFEGKEYHGSDELAIDRPVTDERMRKKIATSSCVKSFCHAAQKIRDVPLPWGVMSGIRPAKVVRQFLDMGMAPDEVKTALGILYETKEEKLDLAIDVALREKEILSTLQPDSVSIYIGIPFCPTRCLYCSFVSTDIRVSGKYMDDYVRLLLEEIKKTGQIMRKMGVFPETIYIGGGTPTTLSADQLRAVLDAVHEHFDLSHLDEFTLEAGRPDTITREKMAAAIKGGVDRVSINPQTMNQETLDKIGRAHTPEEIKTAFSIAREAGFGTINMDLIAGLPDETPAMFESSMEEVISLEPENITVHTMCVKRAAALRFSDIVLTGAKDAETMLSYTQKRMKEEGYFPYYMYRQKNMVGNLENVGYAKQGHISRYNVNIMEEVQTILALGGGASTKLVMGDRIERIFNFKDPCEYIRRFDEILKRKDDVLDIWAERKNNV